MDKEKKPFQSLDALRRMLEAADAERVTKTEFESLANEIMGLVRAIKKKNDDDVQALMEEARMMIKEISSRGAEEYRSIRNTVSSSLDSGLSDIRFSKEALTAELDAKIKQIEETYSANEARMRQIVDEAIARIEFPEQEEPEEITAEKIRDLLESLSGDDRLDISAVKGIKEDIAQRTIVLGGGGGGGSYLTDRIVVPTETPDDSTTQFTFSQKPSIVVVNGAHYREGKGWSWSGTQAVLDGAVGTGGDIYGLM